MKSEALRSLNQRDTRQALFHPDEAGATLRYANPSRYFTPLTFGRKLSASKAEVSTEIEVLMGAVAEVDLQCDNARAL